MTKKVFVSLPMRDRSIDEIREDMNDILNMIKPGYEELGEDVELIDTVWMDTPEPDILDESAWYLGRSIQALSKADIAIFHPGWREARGCIIEHMVCAMYNIPYFDISMDYGDHADEDVEDYTHDWNLAGEINEALSEQVAKAEGLDDILDDEDVEDALGFEHDDGRVILPGTDTILKNLGEGIVHDDVDDLVDSDPDLNPYTQHSEIDKNGKLIDSDILEPGEYNVDVR